MSDKKDEKEQKLDDNEKEEQKKLQEKESCLKNLVIKKGDYSIHVLIENTTNLVMVNDSLPEPIVKISCNNESKRTKNPGIKIKDYFFNEHFYFDHFGINEEIFDSAKILIEVYDRNNSSKEDYLGVVEFDYATIYSKKNHILENNWVALSNIYSTDDFSSVKGYLKLSISILHESDNRIELKTQDNNEGIVGIPPHIKPKYMQLKVRILLEKNSQIKKLSLL